MNLKFSLLFVSFCSLLNSFTYHIKQDGTGNFEFIQEGIDASVNSDTVLVYPGTYFENIDFNGKDITVASLILTTGNQDYIHSTIIDGDQNGSVVIFENDETNDAVLMGFTIQNGSGYDNIYSNCGGGIFINFSSPSLKFLEISNNYANAGGGISFSSTEAYLEAINIKQNHAFKNGGGIFIGRLTPNPIDSDINFSSTNKCNIFNNSAGRCSEIMIMENHSSVVNIIIDTLSVFNPDWNFVSQFPNINLEIEHAWLQQVEHDLYVSPDGDDDNSGLSESEPLKTVQWALAKIKADSLNPRNIYLAEGIYSPASNGELFPLNMRSYVSIIGAGVEETIFEEPMGGAAFITAWYDSGFSLSHSSFRNRLGDNNVYSPLFLSYSDTYLTDLKIENCESNSRSSIYSNYMNIILKNIQIINNCGFSSIGISTYQQENTAIINNSIFIGNDQYEPSCGGGALNVSDMEYCEIKNCLFVKNHAYDNTWPQANIYLLENDTVDFFNNIVYDNASNGGAIAVGKGGTINIKNSIIYGNSNYQFQTHRGYEPTNVNISHSLIQGGIDTEIIGIAGPEPYGVEFNWGDGIIAAAPNFLGGEDEYDPLYYQLAEDSPCIDAGTPDTTGLFLPPWDLLHNHRVWDGDNDGTAIIDIGCYEFCDSVGITQNQLPITSYRLTNYPNPFSSETTISFSVTQNSDFVNLEIYNIKGQKIKTLVDCYMSQGGGDIVWNGDDDSGKSVSSGLYLYKLKVGNQESVKRMLLLK